MDITEKLRELIPNGHGWNSDFAHTMAEAANEIERLRSEPRYDMRGVIGLTHNKTAHIISRDGFAMTGFVLTHEDGRKCIVDMSAVRWFHDKDGRKFFALMHPNETF